VRAITILSLVGASVLVVGALLFVYYPAVPNSVAGWVALIGLGLPVFAGLEWSGDALARSRWLKSRSSTFRVLVGVPLMAGLLMGALLLMWAVQWVIVALSA
jgi:hypothetical protein